MAVYKNKYFTKRDYETSNIVACVAETKPTSPDDRWQEADKSILVNLTPLWIENDVRYYGYL